MKNTIKTYLYLCAIGILMGVIDLYVLFFGIFTSFWLPLIIWLGIQIIISFIVIKDVYEKMRYICPVCNIKFQPEFKEFLFTKYRLLERVVTCPKCHMTGLCDEIHINDIK